VTGDCDARSLAGNITVSIGFKGGPESKFLRSCVKDFWYHDDDDIKGNRCHHMFVFGA